MNSSILFRPLPYAVFLFAMALFIVSCSEGPQSPLNSGLSSSAPKNLLDAGSRTVLQSIPRRTRSKNGFGGTASKIFTSSSGGRLDYMGHALNVPKGAFPEQQKEFFITDVSSDFIQADYGPSGSFAKTVTITISYADADLRNVDLKKMVISWYDETTASWVEVGGTVNTTNQTISVAVNHFTQYTISTK